jgi:beta-1,4-mannosyl-glycoprotein beta-1,4-N-acetylglucosaminyltransferase
MDPQCTKYNFKLIDSNVIHRSLPIYDFFLFDGEFDILEIRLYELYKYVTFFLIAESRETLTGKEKPLYLKENWSKFAKYHDKIRRIEVVLVRNITNAWPNEHRMRNEGLRLALSTITE